MITVILTVAGALTGWGAIMAWQLHLERKGGLRP